MALKKNFYCIVCVTVYINTAQVCDVVVRRCWSEAACGGRWWWVSVWLWVGCCPPGVASVAAASELSPRRRPSTLCRPGTDLRQQASFTPQHKKVKKAGPYSITERRVPAPIPVLGSQPAGDVSHKPGGRLPLLSSARPAVTPATLKKAATNFAAWWTEARWVWTVCLRLLPDSVATATWTQALLRLSPARWPLGYRATP